LSTICWLIVLFLKHLWVSIFHQNHWQIHHYLIGNCTVLTFPTWPTSSLTVDEDSGISRSCFHTQLTPQLSLDFR
jgi:hypothetical protein